MYYTVVYTTLTNQGLLDASKQHASDRSSFRDGSEIGSIYLFIYF